MPKHLKIKNEECEGKVRSIFGKAKMLTSEMNLLIYIVSYNQWIDNILYIFLQILSTQERGPTIIKNQEGYICSPITQIHRYTNPIDNIQRPYEANMQNKTSA